MKQTCKQTGLSYDTLKFYCNEGLIPNVQRNKNNHRMFTEQNIAWINSLACLKNCGMSIQEMKEFLQLCLDGQETIPQRQKLLGIKLQALESKMAQLRESINYIHYKQKYYQDVLKGKADYYSNLSTK